MQGEAASTSSAAANVGSGAESRSAETARMRQESATNGSEEGLGELFGRLMVSARVRGEDALKPLFSTLNTRAVFRRLTYSILPRRRARGRDRSRNLGSGVENLGTMEIVESPDLYSPVMLVITQAALLRPYEENLRIPFLACLAYWLVASLGLFLLGIVLAIVASPSRSVSRRIMGLPSVMSVVGYSLFGPVIISLTVSFTGGATSSMFYPIFLTIGTGSSLCLVLRLYKGTPSSQMKATVMSVWAMLVHMWWIWHCQGRIAAVE